MRSVLGIVVLLSFMAGDFCLASLKIMPLGDSITEGTEKAPGSYRLDLVPLILAKRPDALFIGSKENGPASLVQRHHEGHSGWRIDNLLYGRLWGQSFEQGISLWLPPTQPDLILLMIGTNDIVQNFDLPNAMQRYRALLNEILRLTPASTIFVSSLIPTNNNDLNSKISVFNRGVDLLVSEFIKSGNRLVWVDMEHESGINWTMGDLIDGVHPTVQGYSKMAKVWFSHLGSLLTF